MTATAEQLARVADPSTPATTLAELAQAEPELWAAIARHPNVYPDLVAWMRQYGLADSAVQAEPAAPRAPDLGPAAHSAAGVALPTLRQEAPGAKPWWRDIRSRRLRIAAGSVAAAIVLALTLVATVVIPQQRAAEEAAAALAHEQSEHDGAVKSFTRAEAQCGAANRALSNEIGTAEAQRQIDPATLTDPGLIASLERAIELARSAVPCSSPAMASGTAEIKAQASSIASDALAVQAAAGELKSATRAVDGDIATRVAAEAQEAAEKKAAAEAAAKIARTWQFKDAQGYSFTATVDVQQPTGTFSVDNTSWNLEGGTKGKRHELGDSCSFDPTSDIAVPVKVRVTATTERFETSVSLQFAVTSSREFSRTRTFSIESYYTDYSHCDSVSSGFWGGTASNRVSWNNPLATNASGIATFAVIIHDWKTPNAPNGDTAALPQLTISLSSYTGYSVTGSKGVLLDNEPVR